MLAWRLDARREHRRSRNCAIPFYYTLLACLQHSLPLRITVNPSAAPTLHTMAEEPTTQPQQEGELYT